MSIKILDPETVSYLKEFGISDAEIKRVQKKELKAGALKILERSIKLLIQEDWDALDAMLVCSPAGDGFGCDNCFIDFSGLIPGEHENGVDLSDIIDRLRA